jgi:hypothetical protein
MIPFAGDYDGKDYKTADCRLLLVPIAFIPTNNFSDKEKGGVTSLRCLLRLAEKKMLDSLFVRYIKKFV